SIRRVARIGVFGITRYEEPVRNEIGDQLRHIRLDDGWIHLRITRRDRIADLLHRVRDRWEQRPDLRAHFVQTVIHFVVHREEYGAVGLLLEDDLGTHLGQHSRSSDAWMDEAQQ